MPLNHIRGRAQPLGDGCYTESALDQQCSEKCRNEYATRFSPVIGSIRAFAARSTVSSTSRKLGRRAIWPCEQIVSVCRTLDAPPLDMIGEQVPDYGSPGCPRTPPPIAAWDACLGSWSPG